MSMQCSGGPITCPTKKIILLVLLLAISFTRISEITSLPTSNESEQEAVDDGATPTSTDDPDDDEATANNVLRPAILASNDSQPEGGEPMAIEPRTSFLSANSIPTRGNKNDKKPVVHEPGRHSKLSAAISELRHLLNEELTLLGTSGRGSVGSNKASTVYYPSVDKDDRTGLKMYEMISQK